ncbi:type II secretion system F family protein [Johnsonella ignava]|nr:type II secretion system F family protein [Johnsonella ignava]
MIWLMAISLAVIGYLVSLNFISVLSRNRMRIEKSLDEIEAVGTSPSRLVKKKKKGIKTADLSFIKISENFANNVALSGIKAKPEEFIVLWFFASFIPALLLYTFTEDVVRSSVLVLIGIAAPPIYLMFSISRRRAIFEAQLGDALMILSNALKAGFSFQQALGSVSRNLPDPIGGEFAVAVREQQLGADLETTLMSIADKMKSMDLKLLTTAVVVQQKVGGNLSEIMDTIAQTVRDRQAVARMVKTITAQGRISGIVVGALPIFLLIAITMLNAAYMNPLFKTDLGRIILVICAVMEISGFLIIMKIVDVKL